MKQNSFTYFLKGKPVGFTLAELLIALLILGVIATFTIPKVLSSQQDSKYKSMAKEVISMVSGAYTAYQQNNTVTTATTSAHLTPYMNYVSVVTSGLIDHRPGLGTKDCASPNNCLQLHNGGKIFFDLETFNGTNGTNFVGMVFDPDGVSTGNQDSLSLVLYFPGRITSREHVSPNSQSSTSTINPSPGADPSWFSWN